MTKVKAGPAALLHYDKTGRRLNHLQLVAINDTVTDEGLWGKVIEAWLMRGYNPGNIEGQLAWYRDGIPNGKPITKTFGRETDYSRFITPSRTELYVPPSKEEIADAKRKAGWDIGDDFV